MSRRSAHRFILGCCLALLLVCPGEVLAAPWLPFGPDGGDARRFAADPHDHTHLYLGTANGWIYESHTGGADWKRLARVGKRDDLVLDSIVVDPTDAKHLVVGGWVIDRPDGGLYISRDGGLTWTSQAEMRGQSIRALTAAPSDPKVMVAGTLKGVFRSTDGGDRWTQISPLDSTEIHEIQSVAIDPEDPKVVYAGTWHLPWKTLDAGEHWDNMKQGIIDDSDVFSIIVDPTAPKTVYASACSGIYKSEDAGQQFEKVQGIPSSARRTRVLLQDPNHRDTVWAGTTEGLFRSDDAGKTWTRTTGPEVIVNDVFVDASDSLHVLLATNRGGILASVDRGETFQPSSGGFSARQITAMKRDEKHPATLYVGVVNDKEWGGVFQSDNGGVKWEQQSSGLQGRDVFSLGQAPDGTMIAGTAHGLFRLDAEAKVWNRVERAPAANVPTEAVTVPPAAMPSIRPPVPIARNHFVLRTGLATTRTLPANAKLRPVKGPSAKVRASGAGRRGSRTLPARVRSGAARQKPVVRAKAVRTEARGAKQRSRLVRGAPVAKPRRLVAIATDSPEANPAAAPSPEKAQAPAAVAPVTFDGSVYALVTSEQTVLAATSDGLLLSTDEGASWNAGGPANSAEWRYLAAARKNVLAATLHMMQLSTDSGETWSAIPPPDALTQISSIAVEPSGEVWVGGREGVYVSSDAGGTWTTPKNLYVSSVTNIFYDEATNRIFVTATGTGNVVFQVQLPQKAVTFYDTGWSLRFVRPVGDHLVAATFFDGVVIQPRMMPVPAVKAESASR